MIDLYRNDSHQVHKLTARIFIGTIGTVFFSVTEQATLDTTGVTARQKSVLAQWLVGVEQWLDFAFLVLKFTILHSVLPVTSLLLDIKEQSSWTTDGLDALLGKWNIHIIIAYVFNVRKNDALYCDSQCMC